MSNRQFLVVELAEDQKLYELLKVLLDNSYNVVEVGNSERIEKLDSGISTHIEFLDTMLKDMMSPEYLRSFVEKLVIASVPMVLNNIVANQRQK